MSANIKLQVIPVTPIQQNCRLFSNQDTKQAFVVDPGGDVDHIFNTIVNSDIEDVQAIVLTHGHFDHIGGVTPLRSLLEEKFNKSIPVLGPYKEDQFLFQNVVRDAKLFGLGSYGFQNYDMLPEHGDRFFELDEEIELIGIKFKVRFAPGHCPGHAVLICDEYEFVIAGDVIFKNSIGRTDLEGGDYDQLIESIKGVIYTLDDDYLIMSGHGPNTSVGFEKQTNPFVKG